MAHKEPSELVTSCPLLSQNPGTECLLPVPVPAEALKKVIPAQVLYAFELCPLSSGRVLYKGNPRSNPQGLIHVEICRHLGLK